MKKIVIGFLTLVLLLFITIVFVVNKGNSYEKNLIKEVKKNYGIKDKITYINKYDDYYIFKTTDYLFVIDKEYKKVMQEKVSDLYKIEGKYDIIYNKKRILYEISEVSNDTIKYIDYDIYTGEEVNNIVVGG